MASMKKVVKYRWRPRNGCDGDKYFNNDNSGEFSGIRQDKFTGHLETIEMEN